MSRSVDVYFSLISPWSFLAWDRLHGLGERHGLQLHYHPLDLGIVFPRTGGLPLAKRAPERQRYRLVELERWTKRLGLPLNQAPRFFPAPPAEAEQLVLAARQQQRDVGRLSRAFMAAVWQEDRDIGDLATRRAIVEEQGFDVARLEAMAPSMAAIREQETEAAIAVGVFGVPTFRYGDQLFWGQDRLDLLEEAISA